MCNKRSQPQKMVLSKLKKKNRENMYALFFLWLSRFYEITLGNKYKSELNINLYKYNFSFEKKKNRSYWIRYFSVCDWRTDPRWRCPAFVKWSPTHRQFPAFLDRQPEADVVVSSTMATEVRQELSQLMNSSGSHKDLAAKYVKLNRRNKLHFDLNCARSQMQKCH